MMSDPSSPESPAWGLVPWEDYDDLSEDDAIARLNALHYYLVAKGDYPLAMALESAIANLEHARSVVPEGPDGRTRLMTHARRLHAQTLAIN
jgi:hypothetical protein